MHQSSHCVTLFLIILKKISALTDHTPDTVKADFETATTAEVRQIFMSSPSKSCDLDRLPTILLKECLDVFIIPITDIINASLRSGLFPEDFKCAHVSPIRKKTTPPEEELNSYRPISNLSFISKIQVHLKSCSKSSQVPHLHKWFIKCVTVSTISLNKTVTNDINLNIDNGKVTALALPGLSAAFDTINNDILITRLSKRYRISGTAVSWFID